MKIIKFRVYDKLSKKYIQENSVYIMGALVNGVLTFCADDKNGLLNHHIIEQFTGLYDKNGKEIYEGDILSFSNKWEWYRGSAKNWYQMTREEQIRWVNEQPCYKYVVEYEAPEYNISKSECESWYEVIGNIHESDKHE